ncbi:glycine-rich cell wall structural protein 1.0-like [Diprion similis]|uniref:glycine-rich cell wall structural protein 1.0-like n=1 Tax=Diprion similis TaxID=362088 RepID=UPI001EF79839|nr:glycine-rich cell wall structural protein 1.0-like [Diprion similis]
MRARMMAPMVEGKGVTNLLETSSLCDNERLGNERAAQCTFGYCSGSRVRALTTPPENTYKYTSRGYTRESPSAGKGDGATVRGGGGDGGGGGSAGDGAVHLAARRGRMELRWVPRPRTMPVTAARGFQEGSGSGGGGGGGGAETQSRGATDGSYGNGAAMGPGGGREVVGTYVFIALNVKCNTSDVRCFTTLEERGRF